MRGSKVKQLRKYLKNHLDEFLIILRNEVGERTTKMDTWQIYKNAKKLYLRKKIEIS